MKLTDFEADLPSEILKRGREYFAEERVRHLEKVAGGLWVAEVEGMERYTVEVRTHRHTIKGWECNCPYEHGPICKHAVALFYAIADEMELAQKSKSGKKKPPKKDQVAEIFGKVGKEDLQDFIVQQFRRERTLKNAFIAHFAERLEQADGEKYRTIVRHLHRAASDRRGFVDYRQSQKLAGALQDLVQKAAQLLGAGNFVEALTICQALTEEGCSFLLDMDDSSGRVGGVLTTAFETLHDLAQQAPPPLKDQLFDYCLGEFPKSKYHNFRFDRHFLDILPTVMTTAKQEEQFLALLDAQIEKERKTLYGNYGMVGLLRTKLDYLKEAGRKKETDKLMDENIHLPEIRAMRVKEAMAAKEYETAKTLCQKGLEISEKHGRLATENQWRDKLLEIAQLQKDVPETRRLAEAQFFAGHFGAGYYHILKKTYPKKEWPERYERLIAKIKQKNQGYYGFDDVLAWIYSEENYTERLLSLLQENPRRIDLIEKYWASLQQKFPKETLALYTEAVEELATSTGRSIYNEVARHLKNIQKMEDGEKRVEMLVDDFRERYKMRRAMMEVLGGF